LNHPTPAVRPVAAEPEEWRPSPGPAFEPSAEDESEHLGFRLGSAGIAAAPPAGWDAARRESFTLGNRLGWSEFADASLAPAATDRHPDEVTRAAGVIRSRDLADS
jgi:hypothetical protein